METWICPAIRRDFEMMEYTRKLWVYSYKGELPRYYGDWQSWNQVCGFLAYLRELVIFPN
jgi:hypothetical protein